jgi:hypothetical protein
MQKSNSLKLVKLNESIWKAHYVNCRTRTRIAISEKQLKTNILELFKAFKFNFIQQYPLTGINPSIHSVKRHLIHCMEFQNAKHHAHATHFLEWHSSLLNYKSINFISLEQQYSIFDGKSQNLCKFFFELKNVPHSIWHIWQTIFK